MKKTCIGLLACVAIVGCGGSDNIAGGGGGGGGGGGRSFPGVNLGGPSEVSMVFLTGQGRRAPGSTYAEFGLINIQNGTLDFAPTTFQGSTDPLKIQLDGYTINTYDFNYEISSGAPFKEFTEFPMRVDSMFLEQLGGSLSQFAVNFVTDPPLAIDVALHRGRQTVIQFNLNDGMLFLDNQNQAVFDRQFFEDVNYDIVENAVVGFFGDYLAFDLSAMTAADRPNLELGIGTEAELVLFSGDAIALSAGFDALDSFEILQPLFIDQGIIREAMNLQGLDVPGTYTVLEPDPRVIIQDPDNPARLTALQGSWRPYTEVLDNVGAFAMLVLPNSRGNLQQQVVAFNRTPAGEITAFWQGIVIFDGSGGGTIEMWSIDQVDDGSADNSATGTVTVVGTRDGFAIDGDFTITNSPAGFPFPTSGSFAVFRG